MSTIVIDESLRQTLAATPGSAKLCDQAGNLIGYFTPAASVLLEPQISEEELQRRRSEKERYTVEEVLAHLRSLECSP